MTDIDNACIAIDTVDLVLSVAIMYSTTSTICHDHHPYKLAQ